MALSLTNKIVEFSSGVTGALPLHSDSSTGYLYPLVSVVPTELGGCSVYSFVSNHASVPDDAQAIKTSAGQVYGFTAGSIENAGSAVYLKFYDVASTPTTGTTPVKMRFMLPTAATTADGWTTNVWFPTGIVFGTGIAVALVTGIADSATTNVTAAEVIVNVYYK